METQPIIMYGIALVAIALGFVALLKQKTYIDSETQQPTEIEITGLGKMKTNIPALVFVILGFAAAIYTFHRTRVADKVQWTIKGKLEDKDKKITKWSEGDLRVMPSYVSSTIDPNGNYSIEMEIERGITVEKAIEFIDYSHPMGSIQIYPSDTSIITKKTEHCRFYKPLAIKPF